MTLDSSGMLTYVSSTAVSTCTAMNATASSEMFRCRLVTAKRGRPGRRPWRLTRMPRTRTAVSSSSATTPVARLAYQNAVVPLISLLLSCRRAGLFCSRPSWVPALGGSCRLVLSRL